MMDPVANPLPMVKARRHARWTLVAVTAAWALVAERMATADAVDGVVLDGLWPVLFALGAAATGVLVVRIWSRRWWVAAGALVFAGALSRAVGLAAALVEGTVPFSAAQAHIAGIIWTLVALLLAVTWLWLLGPLVVAEEERRHVERAAVE